MLLVIGSSQLGPGSRPTGNKKWFEVQMFEFNMGIDFVESI